MSYARGAWAQAPYAGTVLPAPDVGDLPPPIPGDAATFAYTAQLGALPWAYPSWAGGYPLPSYPGGGILATPDSSTGVVVLRAWWPDATSLQLVRIDADGTRTPVRGGYPLPVVGSTRRNYVTNPSIEAGLNGYVPDAGSPTLSQLAAADAPAGSYVLRATNAGAGSNGVTVPTSTVVTPAGAPVTVAFALRTSTRPSSLTVSIGWASAAGAALATSSTTLSADQINASVATFARQVVTLTPPNGAYTPTLKIIAAGMLAGGTMDLDALTLEIGTTDGSAFDGTTLGAVWLGTAQLSASVLAPMQTLSDGECPLDTLVRYQVSYPSITGGRVVSDPVLLASEATSWLTHPAQPGTPAPVQLAAVPSLDREITDGVFYPLGGAMPIVVTDGARHAASGSVDLVWLSFAERDVLLGMLADGSPLLLRTPAEYGYDASLWLACHTVTEDRGDRKAWQDAGVLSAEFHQVGRPEEV